MDSDVDISAVAALLANPARAAMLEALLDGAQHTAADLARRGGVRPSTASEHLAQLTKAGLIRGSARGRQRLFVLAGPRVATAIESLAALGRPTPVSSLRGVNTRERLRAGRTCYDHLAGRLGIAVTDALVDVGVLTADLGLRDLAPLTPLRLTLAAGSRRPIVRGCLDWTERREHLAGALPAAFTARLFELDWLRRPDASRAARLTPAGERGLADVIGLHLPLAATG